VKIVESYFTSIEALKRGKYYSIRAFIEAFFDWVDDATRESENDYELIFQGLHEDDEYYCKIIVKRIKDGRQKELMMLRFHEGETISQFFKELKNIVKARREEKKIPYDFIHKITSFVVICPGLSKE